MHRISSRRLVVVLIVLALTAAACGNRDKKSATNATTKNGGNTNTAQPSSIDTSNCTVDPTQQLKGDTIKLVSSFPQSGLTAAFSQISKGWKAYFAYTNEKGGVTIGSKKYKITTSDKDDEYNAQKTSQNIESLVGAGAPDDAFAVFNVVGTANNLAIRQVLGDKCIPNLFAATGSPAFGNPKFPWTIGATNAPYSLEGAAFAGYLKKNKPTATVAMLVQNDDFGNAYEEGLRKAVEGTEIKVVKVEKYQTGAAEVGAQMTSLAATKADAFFDGGTLLACPDALKKEQAANWKPVTWVSATCISKTLMGIAGDAAQGAISMANIQDPVNPKFATGEAMKLYREKVNQYSPGADLDNAIVSYGWTQGALLVKVLEAAKAPTRVAVMESAHNMDGITGGLLLDGIKITTKADKDAFMGETNQVVQYDFAKKYFNEIGTPVDEEGKTAQLTPSNLISG